MGDSIKGFGWRIEGIARIGGGKGPLEGSLIGSVSGFCGGGGLVAAAWRTAMAFAVGLRERLGAINSGWIAMV